MTTTAVYGEDLRLYIEAREQGATPKTARAHVEKKLATQPELEEKSEHGTQHTDEPEITTTYKVKLVGANYRHLERDFTNYYDAYEYIRTKIRHVENYANGGQWLTRYDSDGRRRVMFDGFAGRKPEIFARGVKIYHEAREQGATPKKARALVEKARAEYMARHAYGQRRHTTEEKSEHGTPNITAEETIEVTQNLTAEEKSEHGAQHTTPAIEKYLREREQLTAALESLDNLNPSVAPCITHDIWSELTADEHWVESKKRHLMAELQQIEWRISAERRTEDFVRAVTANLTRETVEERIKTCQHNLKIAHKELAALDTDTPEGRATETEIFNRIGDISHEIKRYTAALERYPDPQPAPPEPEPDPAEVEAARLKAAREVIAAFLERTKDVVPYSVLVREAQMIIEAANKRAECEMNTPKTHKPHENILSTSEVMLWKDSAPGYNVNVRCAASRRKLWQSNQRSRSKLFTCGNTAPKSRAQHA